jgi:hypothetical protein
VSFVYIGICWKRNYKNISVQTNNNDDNLNKHQLPVYSEQDMKRKLGNAIMDSLSEEGFRPELENHFIVFKVEGHTLCFELDDKDEYFARLCFYNIYEVTDENKVLALYNMNYLNKSRKYAKLFMDSDHVSIAIDIFPAENINMIILRMIGIAMGTAKDFYDEMNKGYSCN